MNFSRNSFARLLIGIVLLINLQSALVFIIFPSNFAPAYELTGIPGQTAIRGIAILFLMWNVPYVFAFINPFRFRISLLEAIIMQIIGLFGETILWFSISSEYAVLKNSIMRFILFDFVGFMLLVSALMIIKNNSFDIDTEAS